MKKMIVAALIAVAGMAFTAPAFAVEHEFGGYWRTRAFSYNNFSGEDETEAYDYQAVDTRTRLFYTAVLNDNLKLVNKFEMDADWGNGGTEYGDIGADGVAVEVKNSYADITMGVVNAKIGAHNLTLSRGFLFADDMMGATIAYQGEGFAVPFVWVKPFDGGSGLDSNDDDVDYYAVAPSFTVANFTINPVLLYATSNNISAWNPGVHAAASGPVLSYDGDEPRLNDIDAFDNLDLFFLGLNLDATLGEAKVWFTGLYEDGTLDVVGGGETDISAYIVATGASMNLGMADVHGQAFYASGDDDDDNDLDAFYVPSQNAWTGQSYYWAEIMGYGMMDDMVSNGSCADKISNIMALNLGSSFKPMDKLILKADIWYAELAEADYVAGEDKLGTELDLGLTYELVENLNLDVIAAYLFAGDRTTMDTTTGLQFSDDANPYELGAQLSLSF